MKTSATAASRRRRIAIGAIVALALTGLAAYFAPHDAQAATQKTEWSTELDCSSCHDKEAATFAETPATEADKDSAAASSADKKGTNEAEGSVAVNSYLALHTSTIDTSCSTCHPDSDAMAKAHKRMDSGREAKRLKKTDVTDELCLGCHDQKTLAQATSDSKVLTDSNGTVVNPHDLPKNDDHADVSCMVCHKAHEGQDSLEDSAIDTCAGCHHAGVYECHTCH